MAKGDALPMSNTLGYGLKPVSGAPGQYGQNDAKPWTKPPPVGPTTPPVNNTPPPTQPQMTPLPPSNDNPPAPPMQPPQMPEQPPWYAPPMNPPPWLPFPRQPPMSQNPGNTGISGYGFPNGVPTPPIDGMRQPMNQPSVPEPWRPRWMNPGQQFPMYPYPPQAAPIGPSQGFLAPGGNLGNNPNPIQDINTGQQYPIGQGNGNDWWRNPNIRF